MDLILQLLNYNHNHNKNGILCVLYLGNYLQILNEDNKLPVHVFISVSRADRRKLSNLIYRGVIHNLSKTRKSKNSYNSDSEYQGIMLMIDLSVALYQ